MTHRLSPMRRTWSSATKSRPPGGVQRTATSVSVAGAIRHATSGALRLAFGRPDVARAFSPATDLASGDL